ncbi:methyltransferase domain-containing protein [Kytococcus sedentarius]|uniref:methyltransferase domain-containing protein n=1 Tax=Kytococcus sedentarius TaxID=1276 RepID=UPI00384B49B2
MSFDFAASYEALNPADDDYRFYAHLAQQLGATRVLDLGCGTGVLARMLTAQGCVVTGIDPDESMLQVARSKDPMAK